ncbi:MAG: DNA helicase II [Coxiellaceae bacterium]|nr:DNA helicase II [Coxiellaceae bacterium]
MPRMMNTSLTETLNPPQRDAVTVTNSHCLVLAGAGSGKTRVLVHRIAWLMETQAVSPYSILSVTFTNKAANEMRSRIEKLRGVPLTGMWVGTFHGLAHRLLRTHWHEAGLEQHFQILDSDDQQRMIKRIIRSLELDEERWQPKQAQWFINGHKENARRPGDIDTHDDYFNEMMVKIYSTYEDVCQQGGLVDFAELLLRSLELLQNNPDLVEHYHQRFSHILVDEFQDTNSLQYQWLQTLCGPNTWMMVVGDDDQSIYSWRGAKVENIQRFIDQYLPVKTVRLEQNYRSTENILAAANAVIAFNSERMGKELWTEISRGDPITVYAAFNERDEAYYIAARIQDWVNQGNSLKEIAILYRSNAQSRILEERLIDSQIPYRIYGGQKFFERAEIKDALAYLRLVNNRQDDAAFERVVNLPTRGIGDATMSHLRSVTFTHHCALWQAALVTIEEKSLSARALNALSKFIELINALDTNTETLKLGEQTKLIISQSGLLAHHQKDRSERGQSRVDNLEELINATSQYEPSEDAEDQDMQLTPLSAFLSHVALEAGEGQADQHSDSVSLMTLHAAKGLEFPLIFITGMEENLFPHRMSIEERRGLEEERRLCYVGMTRAMKKLYLCHAESRSLYGREQFQKASRFLSEMPEELLEHVRPTARVSRMQTGSRHPQKSRSSLGQASIDQTGLNIGQRVSHKKFGEGTILNYEGQGEHTRIQVKFDRFGTKWLVASFAKLQAA